MVRTLGKLEQSDNGAWVLAHVDIDAQPQVAQALQTRTVPYGLVFIAEQPIPFLEQVLTETQLREVLVKIMTVAAQQGIGSAPVEVAEPEEDEALAAIDRGDYVEAERLYASLLKRKPSDAYAKVGLAQVQLLIRTQGLDSQVVIKAAQDSPNDLDIQMQCADLEIVIGELEKGFNRLLKLIASLSGDEQKVAKERLITLFALVDPADPRVIKARASLANVLF
jgi:putative thioredoxin